MPRTALALGFGESELSACLELLRRVCQPASSREPHVTVLYQKGRLSDDDRRDYEQSAIDDLIFTGPITFDDEHEATHGLRTLVIACRSSTLEAFSYKPSFPGSLFHVTVYDGPPSEFAALAYEELKQFGWNLAFDDELRSIRMLGTHAPFDVSRYPGASLSQQASDLLSKLAVELAISNDLRALSEQDRLGIVRAVGRKLHEATYLIPLDPLPKIEPQTIEARHVGQAAFWSTSQIADITDAGEYRTAAHSAKLSSFLTTPRLAKAVVESALEYLQQNEPIRFLDPSIGPGIFYAKLRQLIDESLIEKALGIERDMKIASSTSARWQGTPMKVQSGDFLEQTGSPTFNLLVANPPYVRSQKLNKSFAMLRRDLERRLNISMDGRSDLYVYFVLAAHAWLSETGVAAWLLPSEFLVTNYGSALRQYLTSEVQLLRVHTFDNESALFDNARVSTTVVIYRKGRSLDGPSVELTNGGTLAAPTASTTMSSVELQKQERWNWETLHRGAAPRGTITLGELFEIQRGIATGANGWFVLSAEKKDDIGARDTWVRPLIPKSRHLTSNVFDLSNAGVPADNLYLIDTDEPIDSLQRTSPSFAEYLMAAARDVGGRALVSSRKPFYRQERRTPPLFAFVYMAKADVPSSRRFIWNRGQGAILNNYLGLTPREPLRRWLDSDPANIKTLHALLTSLPASELELHGRRYVSDLLKLEPSELKRVRITDPTAAPSGKVVNEPVDAQGDNQ